MAPKKPRRPDQPTDSFPNSRMKELTDILGPGHPLLGSFQSLMPDERSRGRITQELDREMGLPPATAKSYPVDEPAFEKQPHDDARPAFSPDGANEGLPWVNDQMLVPGQVPEYQAFPVETLPQPVRQFVVAQADSLNCDPAAVALPVLSVLSSAIGGHQRIELKRGWSEPAILWTALVNEGPSSHEAILDAAVAPLHAREAIAEQQRQELFPPYRRKLAGYQSNQRSEPQVNLPPAEPIAERSLTVDWSLSALTRLLGKQSTGLLVCPQELDGWLCRTSGNSERASIQRQAWLDLFAGRTVTIEGRKPAKLTPAAVSLTGTLSPDLFSQKFAKQGGDCELTSRLLFASPEARPQCWMDEEVDQATTDGFANVIQKLFSLPQVPSGATRTSCVTLSPAAHNHFTEFMTDLGARQSQIDEALFSWASRLAGQAARLALVIHLARWAAGEAVDPQQCDATSMQHGIALARWFAYEAQRVLKKVSLTAERRTLQQLFEWIRRHGGSVTIRDVCRSNSRKYPTVQAAFAAMTNLEHSGLCRWVDAPSGPQGGRPTRRMEVIPPAPAPTTPGLSPATAELVRKMTEAGTPATPNTIPQTCHEQRTRPGRRNSC